MSLVAFDVGHWRYKALKIRDVVSFCSLDCKQTADLRIVELFSKCLWGPNRRSGVTSPEPRDNQADPRRSPFRYHGNWEDGPEEATARKSVRNLVGRHRNHNAGRWY